MLTSPQALAKTVAELTQGLDGLAQRLAEYKQWGASFAKWRAVIHIGADISTSQAVASNAHALALYSAMSFHYVRERTEKVRR